MTVVRRTHETASPAVALLLLALGVYGLGWGDFTSGAFLLALGGLAAAGAGVHVLRARPAR